MSAANKRIMKELKDIENTASPHFKVNVNTDNILKWDVTLYGPPETPYEGGRFKLDVTLPENYPFKPPLIRFVTKVYHPNINESGGICLDILNSRWSAVLTMAKVFLSLSSFLENPNSDHGIRAEVFKLFTEDKKLFDKNVLEHTRLHAMGHLTEAEKDAVQRKWKS